MEAPSLQGFQLEQTFFGFKPEDRVFLHDNLFNMIWHGDGRWDWDTLYNMPIFLRRRWMKHVKRILEEREDHQKKLADAAKNKRSKRSQPSTPSRSPKK
jgi:hypothetical protein